MLAHLVAMLAYVGLSCGLCWPSLGLWWPTLRVEEVEIELLLLFWLLCVVCGLGCGVWGFWFVVRGLL